MAADKKGSQQPVGNMPLNVATKERIDPLASQHAIAEQERIINEKILRNKAIQELETGGFGGGFSRRDKGWLLLGFAFFYIVCLLVGYRPSITAIIGGGILSAFLLFLAVFLIEEFTKFKFPRIRIPIVDDLVYYLFDLIWNHRIISAGIIFGLMVASTLFIGSDAWESPYDTDRATLEDECGDEQWESCVRLGYFYQQGIEEVKNGLPVQGKRATMRAFSSYKKGCDGGEGRGCFGLWFLWGRNETHAIDRDEALALLKKGCELKNRYSCEIQDLYARGIDIARDAEALDALTDDMAAEAGIILPSEYKEEW